jgi:hypothetical protein
MPKTYLERKRENLTRRVQTLLKKTYELGTYDNIEIAVIISIDGRYTTYRSIDQKSWPLSMEQIV